MSPPAGGQASFDVSVAKPVEVKKKDLIQVKANVSVSEMTQDNSSQQGSDNEDDGCDLKMDVNGKNVYSDKLSATTKERFEITSDFFEAGDKQDIKFSQKCGKTPRSLTVDGMALQGQVMVANSNGGGSGSGSGSGSGGSGGSETTSSDGSKNTDKGNFASSNKPAAFFMGLFAALVVLVI